MTGTYYEENRSNDGLAVNGGMDYSPGGYSNLSVNGFPCKTSTSIIRTPFVGPCLPFFSHFTVTKVSLRRRVR